VKVCNNDGSIPEGGLKLVIEQSRQALKMDKPVAPEDVADLSPLREAQKELGIKGR